MNRTEKDIYLLFNDEVQNAIEAFERIFVGLNKIKCSEKFKNTIFNGIKFAINQLILNVCVVELNSALEDDYLKGDTSQKRFNHFIDELQNKDNKDGIIDKYPRLFEQVRNTLRNYLNANSELILRLDRDIDLILDELFDSHNLLLTEISQDGDTHRGGRSARVLTFRGVDEANDEKIKFKILYKPRPSQIDCKFQDFLKR